ncbi:MAG: acyl-CoA carboxylase subunit epsilon [Candidatus Sericytochromatia bacterium]
MIKITKGNPTDEEIAVIISFIKKNTNEKLKNTNIAISKWKLSSRIIYNNQKNVNLNKIWRNA